MAWRCTGVISYIALGSFLGRVFGDTTYGQLAVFNEVIRLVLDAYVEPVNLDRAMTAADMGLTEALDGDSAYLDAEEFRAYQQPVKDSEADVGLMLSRRYSFLMVVSPRSGSPAAKAGLRAGDILKTIDGRHTRPLSVPVGERLLRGAPGTVVKLKVLRAGVDPLDFSLVRERLLAAPPIGKLMEDGTGYLKVPEFQARTAEEVGSQLAALKRGGAKSLVLDLRGAAYGLPAEAVKVAELFMKGGVVAKLVGRKTAEQTFTADAAKSAWDLPLAVLVDTSTAGPGEVVAAALLDSGSPIVGERTFGRAPVQRAVPLAEGGLVLTVAKYLSPKGTPIHGHGVQPTVSVEATEDQPVGEVGRDPILERARELLKEPPARKAA